MNLWSPIHSSLRIAGAYKRKCSAKLHEWERKRNLRCYHRGGRIPWSTGYYEAKEDFLKQIIHDESMLHLFAEGQALPQNYGIGLDERVVEYPWLFSRLQAGKEKLLDAGSTLNYSHFIEHPRLSGKSTTIITLEPESHAFWNKRVSYVYDDLRDLPFKDNCFDEIVSLSTLEHVGMDNSIYSEKKQFQDSRTRDFILSGKELYRVLNRGGRMWVTVPFGKYVNYGWYQQFDLGLLEELLECFRPGKIHLTFFRYLPSGWQVCEAADCANLEAVPIMSGQKLYTENFNTDLAACSRGVVAIEVMK